MKKVSIIVPVYNAEKYLRKCVDSLVNQTLEDIEIILVSDASPDGSNDIMREYEAEYPGKIHCIYLEKNVRQGGARNRGIDIATGEFIIFVDSDDYVDITMCEKLYHKAKEHDLDIVFSDYYRNLVSEGKKIYKSYVSDEWMGTLDDIKRASLFFGKNMTACKLIRTNLIKENALYFPEKMIYEDTATSMLYYLYAKRIGRVKEALYCWNIRENSSCHALNDKKQFDIAKAGWILREQFIKRGFYDRYKNEVDAIFTMYFYLAPLNKCVMYFDNVPLDTLYYLRDTMKELLPDYRDNPYYLLHGDVERYVYAELNDESPERFKELVDTKTIKKENISYHRVYKKMYDENRDFLELLKNNDHNIAVWGAGKRGRAYLETLDKERKYITCVFDNNKNLWGTSLSTGHEIFGIEFCNKPIDVIISVNGNLVAEIERVVKEHGKDIQVVNLETYMRSEIIRKKENWV